MVLVGNKADLTEEQKLPDEEVNGMASSMDIKYFQCSVKKNINIDEIIEYVIGVLIKQAVEKKMNAVVPKESNIVLDSNQSDTTTSDSKCSC